MMLFATSEPIFFLFIYNYLLKVKKETLFCLFAKLSDYCRPWPVCCFVCRKIFAEMTVKFGEEKRKKKMVNHKKIQKKIQKRPKIQKKPALKHQKKGVEEIFGRRFWGFTFRCLFLDPVFPNLSLSRWGRLPGSETTLLALLSSHSPIGMRSNSGLCLFFAPQFGQF